MSIMEQAMQSQIEGSVIKYEEMCDEIDQLKSQLQQKDKVIEILKSACEFYSTEGAWSLREFFTTTDNENWDYVGGRVARETLKQIEDLTKKEKDLK